MIDHERRIEIKADPDAVWELISDPTRMPEYLDNVTAAEVGAEDVVRVWTNAGGRLFEVLAHVTPIPSERRLSWTAEGAEHRAGRIEVTPGTTTGTSVVTATLSQREAPEDHIVEAVGFGLGHGRTGRDPHEDLGTVLERSLGHLRHYCETGERATGRYR